MFLSGQTNKGGPLQNTSCILPFRPAKIRLFNFAPSKISLVTFLLLLTEKSLAIKAKQQAKVNINRKYITY